MDNPFKKRATEYFDDPAALLSVISPEPLRRFFEGNASSFFDRLTIIVGTPGSGKTTIARLIELDTVIALLRSRNSPDHKELVYALGECDVLDDGRPKILAFRLAAGSDLRNIWELPYTKKVRSSLFRSLIQVRTVLGWLRKLEGVGIDLAKVSIISRPQYEVPASLIHTGDTLEFRNYARSVEERIFKVITALVPPDEGELGRLLPVSVYEPFHIIESFRVPPITGVPGEELSLKPLCIVDDAHELHPDQFEDLEGWLRNREIKIARWLMTRIDAIGTEQFRKALSSSDSQQPGTTRDRDWILKLMQKGASDRRAFKATVKDIAKRYIEQMPVLRRRSIQLEACLAAAHPEITTGQKKDLEKKVELIQRESGFSEERIKLICSQAPKDLLNDERLAIRRILIHREMRKAPQVELFSSDETEPEAQGTPRNVNSALVTGANIQLLHEFDKPFFYSFDRLADASGENIEQFLNLAGALVDTIETRLLRGRDPKLDARIQHTILVSRAKETIENWNFPHSDEVRRLVDFIATRCKSRTLAPNAPLDDGANAFGFPQAEMENFQRNGGSLEAVLHYALA